MQLPHWLKYSATSGAFAFIHVEIFLAERGNDKEATYCTCPCSREANYSSPSNYSFMHSSRFSFVITVF